MHTPTFDQPDTPPAETSAGFIGVFVQRPILSAVISLLIILAGLAAILGVEVRELPDVDRPIVSIDTSFPGATPEAMDAEVTAIIESEVARIDGVVSISSNSRFARSGISIEFSDRVDINVAATDVQNAVASVMNRLPLGIEPPVVIKADNDSSPIMRLAVSSTTLDEGDLADLVADVIQPRLQAVEGVAAADVYGDRRRVIRVRILPVSLAARGFSVQDVARVVATASQSAPSGRLRSDAQEILIRAEAPATTPEAISRLRLDGVTVLGDVAVVEWGSADETTTARVNGAPGVGIAIVRQAQSNTVAVSDGVTRAAEELNESLPEGVDVTVTVDDSIFVRRAIEEVISSLVMATIIVILIIFLFLRSVRATIIPAVTIPISLLGTVAAMYLAGFSINMFTLLALVMATGLVVDDAIVVTENIERWKARGASKRAAAILGTREIVFAVLSTTATLAAVFIPISFMPGQAGSLFSEFGFVLAFAVLVSSFVALTLCPVLTVRFGREGSGAISSGDAVGSRKPKGLGAVYAPMLDFCLRIPIVPIGASVAFAAAAFFVYLGLPQELTPQEDRGRAFMVVQIQDGGNFQYLDSKVREIEQRIIPLTEEGKPGRAVVSISGVGGGNRAFVVLTFKDWAEREERQAEIEALIRPLVSSIPGVSAFVRGGNSLGIRGAGQGLQFAVAAEDYDAAADVAEKLSAQLQQNPMFADVRPNFRVAQPQVTVSIDRDAAAALGVPIDAITTTLNALADEFRAAEIFVGDRVIDVMLSAGGEPVNDPTDLANLFVRTQSGMFVPLSSVATVSETAVASSLGREERRRAVPVTATLAEGVKLGDAVAVMRAAAAETLPGGMSIVLLGEAKLLKANVDSSSLVFGFAALIVFLVLAAQFESFVSAMIIMVTVPFGLAAAVFAIQLTGGSLNYYSQIGLVLLIGIMAKNGILIVEFANQLRDRGMSIRDAAREASMTRLRPVLMTAISTLLGGLPLILGSGAGAELRAALGWIVVGGLGFATFFTLFLTPVAFVALAGLSKPRAAEGNRVEEELSAASAIR